MWVERRRRYVDRVLRRLRDLPPPERAEIAADLSRRIDDLGSITSPELEAELGVPDEWAAGVREAMGLEPWPPRAVRRRHRLIGLAVVVALVGVAVAIIVGRSGANDGPSLAFEGSTMSSGDARFVGSVLEVPARNGASVEFAVVVTNRAHHQVEVVGLTAFPEVTPVQSGVTIHRGGVPVIEAAGRMQPLDDPNDIAIADFNDPRSRNLPVVMEPGSAALLYVKGNVAYCVGNSAGGSVGFRLTLDVVADGKQSTVEGTEISLTLQNCG